MLNHVLNSKILGAVGTMIKRVSFEERFQSQIHIASAGSLCSCIWSLGVGRGVEMEQR